MKFFKFLFFCIFFQLSAQTVKLTPTATISVLTCAPGTELYSTFGHSAIRITDPAQQIDLVYNYGTFDFNTPNFYLKFCRGQLLYELSRYPFYLFPYQYYVDNRWIKSQTLQLTPTETQQIFNYLEWNALPENKKYHYDFFKDNCATRIVDVFTTNIPNLKSKKHTATFGKNTYRSLIHQYLEPNSWYQFGIDLALGSVIDKPIHLKESLFLPDNTYAYLAHCYKGQQKFVKESKVILPVNNIQSIETSLFNPIFVSILLIAILLFNSLILKKSLWIENIYAICFGLGGFTLVFLWFFTDHSATKNNFNIFWLQPFLLIFPLLKNKQWYIILGLFQVTLMWIIGLFQIQQFEFSFYVLSTIPLMLYLKKLIPSKINHGINSFNNNFKI